MERQIFADPISGITGTILCGNQVVGDTDLRPDLEALVDNKIFIIDVSVPHKNNSHVFEEARNRKISKYHPLLAHFHLASYSNVEIIIKLVDALGSWDRNNEKFLRKICMDFYLNVLRTLYISDTIRWSQDINIQHLIGAVQHWLFELCSFFGCVTSRKPRRVNIVNCSLFSLFVCSPCVLE
ncbi:retrovirus-related Pol polyprotein from type-1 retrotransposable element R2 [Nephila pilipes]|uniref:Retrovirus-related Pol polyprotein from type-1 retrotransposable element R2 n=1 Tax=Nephila pilipes TaxID=299642 RepID=A0A8X6UP51_NEPPI|nr:retrovirus-related Pol polyprotein from type-1 retrotransposable element R2 [Nephila pilipes]